MGIYSQRVNKLLREDCFDGAFAEEFSLWKLAKMWMRQVIDSKLLLRNPNHFPTTHPNRLDPPAVYPQQGRKAWLLPIVTSLH